MNNIKKIFFITTWIFFLFWALLLIFKSKPIEFTSEQKKYIWNWKGDWVNLIINKNFYIDYKKNKWNFNSSVSWPIISFNKENFSVWFSFLKKTFKIDKTPHKELWLWKMTIDWNKLSKTIDASELSIPQTQELNKLINWFTELFNNSVLKNNHKLLYDWISETWKTQTDVNFFKKTFPESKIKNVNLDGLINNKIVYSKPPYFDKNNFLVLKWYYLTKPKYNFTYTFVYEYPEWKIAWFKFY